MGLKKKVYSIVILERFMNETLSIEATNPVVTTDKELVDKTVEKLKETHKLDGQEWEKYDYETSEGFSYSCYDEDGDGFTIYVNIFEIEI